MGSGHELRLLHHRPRLLSYSELTKAMTCEAQWDFAYGGHLAGHTFKAQELAPLLGKGRAWGAGVAAWHSTEGEAESRLHAHGVLRETFERDVSEQKEKGLLVPPQRIVDGLNDLGAMLDHYMSTATKIVGLRRLEEEFVIPIPSRSGRQVSNKYRFHGFIDGFVTDAHGYDWVVEFKLRLQLMPLRLVRRQRQVRWYAWGHHRNTGRPVAGVIVDERLNAVPKPAQIVKGRGKGQVRPSEDQRQRTTPELYVEACRRTGAEPNPEFIRLLSQRRWQERWEIPFGPADLAEAGRELVSSAQRIRELDSGTRYPVRNAQKKLCSGCDFEPVCDNPRDSLFAGTMFDFDQPKRLRGLDTTEGEDDGLGERRAA